jgi:ubiquinone/menaquinone biosynthesis C-methylase UbiE
MEKSRPRLTRRDSVQRTNFMGITSRLLNQWRKPTGRLGRLLAWVLNISHSRVNDWGLKHVSIEKHDTILDVGCGGGMTVHKLAGIATAGKVYGVDFSEESVAVSRRTNKQLIRMGRAEIRHGSVSCLPFSDDTFDLVTAVDSHYYWPDLVADMQEVLRVLKPGGRLVIIGEAYKGGKYDERDRKFVELVNLAYHSVDELGELISRAGYSDVQMFEEYDKGWMCGIGTKPS